MQNLARKETQTALVNPVAPAGEEEKVASILGAIKQHLGFVPDGLRLYSFSS